jgi:DNA methylase
MTRPVELEMVVASRLAEYRRFLEAKRPRARVYGSPVDAKSIHPRAQLFQRNAVRWAVAGGRRALFENFGLGKTLQQIETVRLILAAVGGRGLIVAPLGVRQEFMEEAAKLGVTITFVRETSEIGGDGIFLTNYESVREGKIDVSIFAVVSLDEAAILRGFGGTKTFREFMRLFEHTPYRFVATATPSPNEYIELLAYAAFLGIMDVGEAKTRFFKRDSEHADQLTLHPHKVDEFWLWVHSWALFVQRPSDICGHAGSDEPCMCDEGYIRPPLQVEWVCVDGAAATEAGVERDGQGKLLRTDSLGVVGAAREKRASLPVRVAEVARRLAAEPEEHAIVWHDLEDERRAIEASVPGLVAVYGSQPIETRESTIRAFKAGTLARVAAKPVMFGAGGNLQHHCAWAIFAGVGFKFADFIQAIKRLDRYGQTRPVRITIVYGSAEAEVVRELQAKWQQDDAQRARMSALLREHGLTSIEAHETLVRSVGVEREERSGAGWFAVLNDTVEETMTMPTDSIDGMILTSIPFGTQYEYTPSYNDFGHTDDDAHFWRQMDFLSPELYRVLAPGRVMAVHVKDRVRPGGMDDLGFQTVSPFHANAILHYGAAGFAYVGMITIATDVVRENMQTHRLGWGEQCKDGSRMSVGMPEYVLLFRKPPSDRSNGYADTRVVKSRTEYSRGRWQIDAHAFQRSNGNRLLTAAELRSLPADEIFRRFRDWTATTVYDHEQVVAIAEGLDAARRLPPGFMLLQPASTIDDVWTDVVRMRSLNTLQAAKGREQHLCPLPFDIVDRLINRYTNVGECVFDPFAGLFTVPLEAVKLGRRGRGHELNARYVADGIRYLEAEAEKRSVPTLFDLVDVEGAT